MRPTPWSPSSPVKEKSESASSSAFAAATKRHRRETPMADQALVAHGVTRAARRGGALARDVAGAVRGSATLVSDGAARKRGHGAADFQADRRERQGAQPGRGSRARDRRADGSARSGNAVDQHVPRSRGGAPSRLS